MRATLAYTSARIVLLVVSVVLLYLAGARGLLLLALAFVVSGIASFVLLSRQRDVMSGALMARLKNRRPRLVRRSRCLRWISFSRLSRAECFSGFCPPSRSSVPDAASGFF